MDQATEVDETIETNTNMNNDQIKSIKTKNGAEVVIEGIEKHTTNINEMKKVIEDMEKTVEENGAENVVFLGEGSAVSAGITQESMGSAALGGDQQVMAYRAKELGIKQIDSWDITLEEQLTFSSSLYGAENALIWMLSQSTIALRNQGKVINLKNTLKMLNRFGLTKEKIVTSLDDTKTTEALKGEEEINMFLKSNAGFTLSAVNEDDKKYRVLTQVASPTNTKSDTDRLPEGLISAAMIAGSLSKERNKRFSEKVKKYANEGKTIVISCGGDHVDSFIEILRNSNT